MTITAKVIADSVHYYGGRPRRVTTFECRLNRTILAELNTHKLLSRNTSSSRAIPIAKMIADVEMKVAPYESAMTAGWLLLPATR